MICPEKRTIRQFLICCFCVTLLLVAVLSTISFASDSFTVPPVYIAQAVDIWRTKYDARPNIFHIDETTVIGEKSCGDPESDLGVEAIIACFGVMDLTRYAGRSGVAKQNITKVVGVPCQESPALCDKFSPVSYVSADAPPVLLIHGTDDEAVSIDNSEVLAEALEEIGATVKFLPVRNAGHAFIWKIHSPQVEYAIEEIRQFLQNLFGRR